MVGAVKAATDQLLVVLVDLVVAVVERVSPLTDTAAPAVRWVAAEVAIPLMVDPAKAALLVVAVAVAARQAVEPDWLFSIGQRDINYEIRMD